MSNLPEKFSGDLPGEFSDDLPVQFLLLVLMSRVIFIFFWGHVLVIFGIIFWTTFWSLFGPLLGAISGLMALV